MSEKVDMDHLDPTTKALIAASEAEVERLRKWLVHFSRENLAGNPTRWTTLTSEKLHAALRGDPAPPFHNALTGEITP